MSKQKKLIAFNYFGGKYRFLEELYYLFPEHLHFVDLFGGSFVVTLNKKPSKLDTVNDIDKSIINFFKILRNEPDCLINQLELTPVSRDEYNNAFPYDDINDSDIERARKFFIRLRMSFQGSGTVKHTGFNACVTTTQNNKSKNVVKFRNSVEKLGGIVERLQNLQIENLDYKLLLDKYDRPGTFFYADPPYELKERNYKKFYQNEFTDEDHRKLSEKLHKIKGLAMISHYETKLYKELYKDWNIIRFKPVGHAIKKGKQKECVWINYKQNISPELQFTI